MVDESDVRDRSGAVCLWKANTQMSEGESEGESEADRTRRDYKSALRHIVLTTGSGVAQSLVGLWGRREPTSGLGFYKRAVKYRVGVKILTSQD